MYRRNNDTFSNILTHIFFLFLVRYIKLSTARKHKDDDLKKKLLLPLLLLLKLKLKTILPIFVGLIGIKAIKALILSKLALTLVIGFIAYSMMKKPAAAAPGKQTQIIRKVQTIVFYSNCFPITATDASTAAPASSYDPSSWDPAATSGGPYARVWDPSAAHNLAYSAYYSGSSANSGSSSSSSSASATSKPSTYSTI